MYEKIKAFNSNKELEVEFLPKNDDIQKGLLNEINKFGEIKILKNPKINELIENINFCNNIQIVDDELTFKK